MKKITSKREGEKCLLCLDKKLTPCFIKGIWVWGKCPRCMGGINEYKETQVIGGGEMKGNCKWRKEGICVCPDYPYDKFCDNDMFDTCDNYEEDEGEELYDRQRSS